MMKSDSRRSADTARGVMPRSFSRLRFTSNTLASVTTSGACAIARPQQKSMKLRTTNIRAIGIPELLSFSSSLSLALRSSEGLFEGLFELIHMREVTLRINKWIRIIGAALF